MAAQPTSDPPIIQAARDGDIEAVQTLIEHDADLDAVGARGATALCRAADGGHAEIVELLLSRGASRYRGFGPGHWAYASGKGVQWDVIAITRADPSVKAVWRSGGKPVQFDRCTMTEMVVKTVDHIRIVGVKSDSLIELEQFAEVDGRFTRLSLAGELEAARTGPNIAIYREFTAPVSTYVEPNHKFSLSMGAVVADTFEIDVSGAVSETLTAFRCASTLVKGSYFQMAFAHHQLRAWLEAACFTDARRQLREVYHYFEAPELDANITELQLEVA